MLEWFLDSLVSQTTKEEREQIQFIFIDRYCKTNGRHNWFVQHKGLSDFHSVIKTPVKPNVWHGKHRLTKSDYFAAANYRNTGVLLAEADHLVLVDDLSVMMPGWWDSVKKSRDEQRIYLGAYGKHKDMKVVGGRLVSSDPFEAGIDSRVKISPTTRSCSGSWMYGSSVAMPTEALLQVNGFDEDCDSMGGEDYACGIMMERRGWEFVFCTEMMTVESEEHHYIGVILKHIIKPHPDPAQKDYSHVYLNWVNTGSRLSGAFYNNDGLSLREARKQVLKTKELPKCSIPEHDWRDGQPLAEM